MLGKFITFEGTDGLGKTTNIKLLAEYLRNHNKEILITREPGGTKIAEAIRKVMLQAYDDEEIVLDTELLLGYAARMQHVEKIIKPALNKGTWVISDRFFDSSFAYQGARGVPLERITALHTLLLGDFAPDCTLLFDAPIEVGLSRIGQGKRDRFENQELLLKVRQIYLQLAKKARIHLVDATKSRAVVEAEVIKIVQESCL